MPRESKASDSIRMKFGITSSKPEDFERIKQLGELEARMRGWYLISSNGIEQMLAKIIAGHFIPNDPEEQLSLVSVVVNEATFRQKSEMVNTLLKQEHPALFENYSPWLRLVRAMVSQRNDMAHGIFGPSDDYVKDKKTDRIQLRFIRNGKLRTSEITVQRFNKDISDAEKLQLKLLELELKVREESLKNDHSISPS